MNVYEGMAVKANQVLGKIDDNQPKLQLDAALCRSEAAKMEAESSVEIEYSEKATEVAKATWDGAILANKEALNAVGRIQVLEHRLNYEKVFLKSNAPKKKRKLQKRLSLQNTHKRMWLKEATRRYRFVSPIDGVITEVPPHIGEWVKPGDVIFHVVNMRKASGSGQSNPDSK